MSRARQDLEDRVRKAIFQHALFRWESATIIALTLLLSFFGPHVDAISFVRSWMWLLSGIVAEGALIYTGLSDPKMAQQAVEELLQDEFKPARLRDKALQRQVEKALDYRSRIEAAIQTQPDGILKNNLTETATQIDDWLKNIYNLAQRLDRHLQESAVLHRDREQALQRIDQLRQEIEVEPDQAVREQMRVTMSGLERQVETIISLDNTMERAALQLENTLSALGTIYSQAMLFDAKDIDRGRAKRLQQEIAEEVTGLSDVLVAMEEVYAAGAEGSSAAI